MSAPSNFREEMTLREARDLLRELVDDGYPCPCCTQFAKVYKRKLTSASVRALIALYLDNGTEPAHLPTVVKERLPDVAHQGGYMTLSAHWDLIREEKVDRPDGGRAGYWQVTVTGAAFLRADLSIPKYAHLYDGRRLRYSGELVSVRDCLGSRFDYSDLMAGL